MTRAEKIKRKAIGYGLVIRDIMIMHGAKKEPSETVSKAVQIAYLAGAAEADANPINIWNPTDGEDERTRNEIIAFVEQAIHRGGGTPIPQNQEYRWIAWLEKQGEQPKQDNSDVKDYNNIDPHFGKPINKTEPKFHEGEWVILTAGELSTTLQIVNVDTNKKIYWFNDSSYLPIVDEECLQLWTIQDAKDGDVLASELCDSVILFKGIKDNNIDFYCDYDFSKLDVPGDRFAINNGQHYGSLEETEDFHPATKEQRDTLMKAMADAGYTFDFVKKELRKIGQKPAEWSEEDERMYRGLHDLIYSTPYCDSRKDFSDWLKSLRPHKQWKPSDEQMEALWNVYQGGKEQAELATLYTDLKKLRNK